MSEKALGGKILADHRIYQPAMDVDRPKEIFVVIADRIEARNVGDAPRILDVGCASGSFLHYLHGRFPNAHLSGTDISDVLVERASELLPHGEFFTGSIDSGGALPRATYDVTCSVGVMCYFDDIEKPLTNLVESVKGGGTVLISTMINPHPIDVVTRHRRSSTDGQGEWEIGWNIFSKQTYESVLSRLQSKMSWGWQEVDMPFALEKRTDPMRSWTIETEENKYQLVNGASQMINMQLLEIHVEHSAD